MRNRYFLGCSVPYLSIHSMFVLSQRTVCTVLWYARSVFLTVRADGTLVCSLRLTDTTLNNRVVLLLIQRLASHRIEPLQNRCWLFPISPSTAVVLRPPSQSQVDLYSSLLRAHSGYFLAIARNLPLFFSFPLFYRRPSPLVFFFYHSPIVCGVMSVVRPRRKSASMLTLLL